MTWTAAASVHGDELHDYMLALDTLRLPPLNTSMLSPRGFAVDLPTWRAARISIGGIPMSRAERDRNAEHPVSLLGPMLGADTIRELRPYPYAVVDELSWPSPYAVATAVVSLCLAGVPVATSELSHIVRSMIDAGLLTVSDGVDPDTVRNPHGRELLSIAIRRQAHHIYGFRPTSDPAYPLISVIINRHDRAETMQVVHDISRQSWANIHLHVVAGSERARVEDETTVLQAASGSKVPASLSSWDSLAGDVTRVGSVYLTRMVPTIAYGPHHLEDLVHALGHSGAVVARTPSRFSYDTRYGLVLERSQATGEISGDDGMAGAALWYAEHGPDGSERGGGYLIHGCNAITLEGPGRRVADADPGSVIVHRSAPPQLAWLKQDPMEAVGASATLLGSYFARSNSGDRS